MKSGWTHRFGQLLPATFLMAGLLALSAGCGKEPSVSSELSPELSDGLDEFGLPELPIREVEVDAGLNRSDHLEVTPEGEGHPGDLITQVFPIPSGFTLMSKQAADGTTTRMSGKEVLESFGIVFGSGASVIVNPLTGQVIVRQTREQMKLVEVVIGARHSGVSPIINIRVEIYQLPALSALKLQKMAEGTLDNGDEWEATLRLVKEGTAKFITSATIQTKSGQRARLKDTFEVIHSSDFDWQNAEKSKSIAPVFSTREVGTIFEVDPIIGGDEKSIEISLSLEHHTAPPTRETVSVAIPGTERAFDVVTPVFHAKKITTQLVLFDGDVKLIGAWRPTGKPDFESGDVMQVAFLKMDIQTTASPN